MMGEKKRGEGLLRKAGRMTAGILAAVLLILAVFSAGGQPAVQASESDDAMKKGYPGLCMDGVGYSTRSIRAGGDIYEETKGPLETGRNRALLYWAFVSNREDGTGEGQKYRTFRETVNRNIKEQKSSLPPITQVSVADIKKIIHQDPQVADRYPWLEAALEQPEEYLRLGSLGTSVGERPVPQPLSGAGSPEHAWVLEGEEGPAGYSLSIGDQDFIDQVQISFVSGGEGWSWSKGAGTITFWNTGGAPGAVAALDLSDTDYQLTDVEMDGEQLYEDCMHWYVVTRCGGDHFFQGYRDGICPLEKHQRLYSADLPDRQERKVYVKMGDVLPASEEDQPVIWLHEESFSAHYTIQARKRDYETGKPLEGALFSVLEAFPDRDQVLEKDGAGVLCADHFSPSPAVWEGFLSCAELVTDQDGCLSHTDTRTYEYSKTYCDGHPTPAFRRIPEKDRDPETGEVTNQGEIDRAKDVNRALAAGWLRTVEACGQMAEEEPGVHFHWLLADRLKSEVQNTRDTGEPCRAAGAVSKETAFSRSGCREDCEDTYQSFIHLRYSYTLREEKARSGYTVHGAHQEDIPVEVITAASSEAGGEGQFAGYYSREKETDSKLRGVSRRTDGERTDGETPENRAGAENEGRGNTEDADSAAPGQKPEFAAGETVPLFTAIELERISLEPAMEQEIPEENGTEWATPSEWDPAEKRTSSATPSKWELTGKERSSATSSEWELATRSEQKMAPSPAAAAKEERGGFSRAQLLSPQPDGISVSGRKEDGERVAHVFQIYDHRTEGEIHFNKRDLELYRQENGQYSSFGRAQGDGTMEGAVYGLFADEDIVHPDGSTGVVYEKGDLAAVAATDKNGDGAFLVYTEAPGTKFSYETGTIEKTGFSGPDNLYHGGVFEDFPGEDGENRRRVYGDNQKDNGNVWIGRPLILGKYKIKELSRSEGYELSVNGRSGAVTNFGASLEEKEEAEKGTVTVVRPLEEDVQTDESGYGELEFSVCSQGTGREGYELRISGYPEGTEFFREDEGTAEVSVEVGTGIYEKVLLWEDEAGTVPRYRRAVSDQSDPVYRDGVPVTEVRQMGRSGLYLMEAELQQLDEDAILKAVRGESLGDGTGACRDDGKNSALYRGSKAQDYYIKYKVEKALRSGGYATPQDGEGRYSQEERPVFDRGVRKGETDLYGISGCRPGEKADRTVYGNGVTEVKISAQEDLTVGDMIRTLLSYYEECPWWSYGGVDELRKEGDQWICTLYQAVPELGEGFFISGKDSSEAERIYWRKGWEPSDPGKCPRWVYAVYGISGGEGVFGRIVRAEWENGTETGETGAGIRAITAEVTPDFTVSHEGDLVPWLQEFPVYHSRGEIVLGPDGQPEQEWEYREVTSLQTVKRRETRSVRLPAVYDPEKGEYRIQISGEFTDSFGQSASDQEPLCLNFRAVTPEREKELTEEDILGLTENWMGWKVKDQVGYGRFLLMSGAEVSAFRRDDRAEADEKNTYIRKIALEYEDEETAWEDGGTRESPVQVLERPIRQKIRIRKSVVSHEDNTYPAEEPAALPGFQFKLYLKSNLERLYRDENGTVVWLDRDGKETDPRAEAPPELVWEESASVSALYTKVPHLTDSKTTGAVSNNVRKEAVEAKDLLYPYENGLLADEPEPGYVHLLETCKESENGGTAYNYEKFFQAVRVANEDWWDRNEEKGGSPGRSDGVRQFAIDWYLADEVKKRTQDNGRGEREPSGGTAGTMTEVHDQALEAAVEKARNYLKPFFAWDLDEICAVSWDSGAQGGTDGDLTTLEASQPDGDGTYVGISRYLPYGIYVAVEQQPVQMKQKQYETEPPREILVPSIREKDGTFSRSYVYDPEASAQEQTAAFRIRFREEWGEGEQPEDGFVIRAHSRDGDFQVYKYGLEPDRLKGDGCLGYEISQSLYRPFKDIYSRENGESRYHNQAVGEYFPYGSVSEDGEEGDGIRRMTGVLTAREGEYAPVLVPWTVIDPGRMPSGRPLEGYASEDWENQLFRAFLRIEKTDRETGEPILHDEAIFAVFRGARREDPDGNGEALFYEEDTEIFGSREFLEAMGAENIAPVSGGNSDQPERFSGTVPAGTPVCREEDQVCLADTEGKKVGEYLAFSTADEKKMADSDAGELVWGSQSTGYVTLPRPLGAGVYVILELRPPAGYVRSRPVAVELYSDQVTFCLDGDPEKKMRAEQYSGQDSDVSRRLPSTVRIQVRNSPIRLTAEKRRTSEKTAEMILDGRLTGSVTELGGRYGLENLELAYNASGRYLGYGWKKGFLEEMESLKDSGTEAELLYENGIFSGRVKLTAALEEVSEDERFVAGAEMTLWEGIALNESGETQDLRYEGLKVERGRDGTVSRMYVEKGFGGERLVLKKTGTDHPSASENAVWTAAWVQREDTDILYYRLDDLEVFYKKDGRYLGYDRNGRTIGLKNGEPAFALKDGQPFLEILCPDYERLHYSRTDHVFDQVPEGTVMYHVDQDGVRDCLVDPYTGMAYVENPGKGVMVWPVRIWKTEEGETAGWEKIQTYRAAAVQDDSGAVYTVGTYDGERERFLREVSPVLDVHGLPLYSQKSEESYEKGRLLTDRDGDPLCFRQNGALGCNNQNSYQIQTPKQLLQTEETMYRRLGEGYLMENTWRTGDKNVNDPFSNEVSGGQPDVLERIAPGWYILEEKTPPDGWGRMMPAAVTVKETEQEQTISVEESPTRVLFQKVDRPDFWQTEVSDGSGEKDQPEIFLKGKGTFRYEGIAGAELALYPARKVYDPAAGEFRWEKTGGSVLSWTSSREPAVFEGIPAGTYLLEEQDAPPGCLPASAPIEISSAGELQYFSLNDDHTRAAFFKYTLEDGRKVPLSNRMRAELALYPARTDSRGVPLTDGQGRPLWKETEPVEVWQTEDCLEYTQVTDTRIYEKKSVFSRLISWIGELTGLGSDRSLTGFTWDYEKMFQEYGTDFDTVSWKEERSAVRSSVSDQVWLSPEGGRIVAGEESVLFPESMSQEDRAGFRKALENGDGRTEISWLLERQAVRIASEETAGKESGIQLWRADDGDVIRIAFSSNSSALTFEYQFHYREFSPEPGVNAVSYNTADGRHHVERLPFHNGQENGKGLYVLVETRTPEGFLPVDPVLVEIGRTDELQLYSMENRERSVLAGKEGEDGRPVEGALLGLYRAGDQGEAVLDDAHLVTTWRSGSDGVYTKEEAALGMIPGGMEAGDLRLHRIRRAGAGDYYLAELEPPPYYIPMEPVLLTVKEEETAVVSGVNRVKTGRVMVKKTDESGEIPLSGAVFTLSNRDTGQSWEMTTGEDGIASVSDLPVGKVTENGRVEPFHYRLEETRPPQFYQISWEPAEFSFEDQEGAELLASWTVQDKKTEIQVLKTDYDSGVPVSGARLEVFRAVREEGQLREGEQLPAGEQLRAEEQIQSGEQLQAEGEALDCWVSDGTPHKITGRLEAGGLYLLRETEAPDGYGPSKEMWFLMSEDGREICMAGDSLGGIGIQRSGSAVTALKVKGFQPAASECLTETAEERGKQPPPSVSGDSGSSLSVSDGWIWVKEILSGGGEKQVARETLLHRKGGEPLPPCFSRKLLYVQAVLTGSDYGEIRRWRPGKGWEIIRLADGKEPEGPGSGTFTLTESAVFSDGTEQAAGKKRVRLGDDGRWTELQVFNRRRSLEISKQDENKTGELSGALLVLKREDGTEADRWVSGEIPHRISQEIKAGEWYVLEEVQAPSGYQRAEPVWFRLSESEGEKLVILKNRKKGKDRERGKPRLPGEESEPENPPAGPEAPIPEPGSAPERIGRIYAYYPADVRSERRRLPGLGDPAGFPAALIAGLAGVLLLIFCAYGEKRK